MPELALPLPISGFTWRPQRLRGFSSQLCQVLDLILFGAIFFSLVLLPFFHQGARERTFAEFLEVRVALRDVLLAVLSLSAWRVILWLSGVYAHRSSGSFFDYLMRCIIGLNGCTVVVGLMLPLLHSTNSLWRTIEIFWLLCLLAMAAVRGALATYDLGVRPHFRHPRNLIIVGSGPRALRVFEDFRANNEWDYHVLGFIDSDPQSVGIPHEMILGGLDDLAHILMRTVVDEVVIALPMRSQYLSVGRAIEICQMLGVQSHYFTDYFGSSLTKRRSSAGPQTGRVILDVVHSGYRLHVKRAIDIAFSLTGLVLLSPVLLLTAIAVKLTSPGPILFKQERFGLHKRTFYMLKFRSMCVDAESKQAAIEHLNETSGPAFKIKNDPRVTSIGQFLRKMSIDELPQLFNVLRGEMSLVGPRPLPLRDVNRFSEAWLMRRFSVKPGVTCLWQVMGRSNTDFERWIQLDLRYIDEWSLVLDLMIIARTIPAVLSSRGAA